MQRKGKIVWRNPKFLLLTLFHNFSPEIHFRRNLQEKPSAYQVRKLESDGFSHYLPAWWPGKRWLNVELVLEMFPLWAGDVSFTKLTVSLERKIHEAWIGKLIQIKKRNGVEYSNSKPVFVLLNLGSTCLQAVDYIIMYFFMVHSHLSAKLRKSLWQL